MSTTTLIPDLLPAPDLLAASVAAGRMVDLRYAAAGRSLAAGHEWVARQDALLALADELEERHLRKAWLAERGRRPDPTAAAVVMW